MCLTDRPPAAGRKSEKLSATRLDCQPRDVSLRRAARRGHSTTRVSLFYSLAISIRSNSTHESTTTSASLDGLGEGLAPLDGIRLPGADCGIAYQTIPNAHRILYDRVAAIQSLSIVPWS